MEPIRTAILGYGRSGSTMHVNAIEKNPVFQLAAVCDIDPERRKQASERHHCPVYENYFTMLRKERLDLVIVVTRSDQHCKMTCDGLKRGVNVLVTKPWAVNQREAGRMVATAQRTGKNLFPWLPARWGGDLRRLKQLVAEKAIGNVFLIRRAVTSFATRADWQTQKRCGGGYLLNWGPHIVDPAVLLGGAKAKTVFGHFAQTINPGDTEDVFLALIKLENGVAVQADFTISVAGLPSWFIQGDRGTIVVHDRNIKIIKKTPDRPPDPTRYNSGMSDPGQTIEETVQGALYGDEVEIYAELAKALRGEQPFAVTPADALELSRIFDAIRSSHEKNKLITL